MNTWNMKLVCWINFDTKTLHRQNKCQYLLRILLFCFNKCLLLLSAIVVSFCVFWTLGQQRAAESENLQKNVCQPSAQCPVLLLMFNVQCSMSIYVYYESRLSDIQWLSVSVHVIRFSDFLFDLAHFSFEQFLCCLLMRSKMLFDCKNLLLFAVKV